MENSKVSRERLHEQTVEDKLSKDYSDDEMLSSVLREKTKNSEVSSEQRHESTSEDTLSRDNSDDEMLSSAVKRARGLLLKSKHDEHQTPQIQDGIMDSDSFNGSAKMVSESINREGFMNSHQVEDPPVDHDLIDSEDELDVSVFPDNAVSRRKLRMVIDPEDED